VPKKAVTGVKKLLIFLFLMVFLSSSALAQEFLAPDAFFFQLPRGWKCDYSKISDYSSPEEGIFFLGSATDSHMMLECQIYDYRKHYGAFSLYRANKRDKMTYMINIEAAYEKETLTYLKTFQENPSKIPFLIYHVEGDVDGEYYYVDTISGGWCIAFFFYPYYADDRLNDENLAELESILATFEPIR